MWIFVTTFVLLTAGLKAVTFHNIKEQYLYAQCPENHVVSKISSERIDKDRLWTVECQPVDESLSCYWTGFHFPYQQELNFNCKANQVMGGIFSSYNLEHEDRQWAFRCCSTENQITFMCQESPTVNYFNESFSWWVPGDNFLTGIRTHQKNAEGDHRWSYNYCRATILDSTDVNSEILTANSALSAKLTEGDVVDSGKRNALNCPNCQWAKSGSLVSVPYHIGKSFSSTERSVIEKAIQSFHLSTCVRFTPRVEQSDYVSIIKDTGCWSYIGRTSGAQKLSLGSGCIHHGIAQHELIHALGFWHEQSRTDRDIYIKINYENIKDGLEANFQIHDTNNLNVAYDYASVMHYGPKDFSKNGKDTITSYGGDIGQRVGMSELDIKKINKLYDCTEYLNKLNEWDNKLGETLSHQCPEGQSVSGISSSFYSKERDRQWGIACRALEKLNKCQWSDFVNDHWGEINFQCPTDQVITGVYSEPGKVLQDRRWKFNCCSASSLTITNCKETPWVNYWQEFFHFLVPGSNSLTGVKSTYDSQTRDRRWSFTYCQHS